MEYPRTNLEAAIAVAIHYQSKYEEKHYGPEFQSAMLTSWRQVLEALRKGEDLHLVD
jgi:hypothetical protein